MKCVALFCTFTFILHKCSSHDGYSVGEKVKRRVEGLVNYTPVYFHIPDSDRFYHEVQLPLQKDLYSDQVAYGFKASYTTPSFDGPVRQLADSTGSLLAISSERINEGEEISDDDDELPLVRKRNYNPSISSYTSPKESHTFKPRPFAYNPIMIYEKCYSSKPAPEPEVPEYEVSFIRPDLSPPKIRERVYSKKPENFDAILEAYMKLAQQVPFEDDIPTYPHSFPLIKTRMRSKPHHKNTDKYLLRLFHSENPSAEFANIEESDNFRNVVRGVVDSFPLKKLSNAKGRLSSYENDYNTGERQHTSQSEYNQLKKPKSLGLSQPYLRSYRVVEKPYTVKASSIEDF